MKESLLEILTVPDFVAVSVSGNVRFITCVFGVANV